MSISSVNRSMCYLRIWLSDWEILISQIFAEIFLSAVLTERFFAKTVKFGVVWWGVVEDEAVQQLERARGLLREREESFVELEERRLESVWVLQMRRREERLLLVRRGLYASSHEHRHRGRCWWKRV